MEFLLPRRKAKRPYALSGDRPYQGFYEPKDGDTIIDAGAEVGVDTIPLGKAVGEEGTVIAIEPEPLNTEYLQKNICLNELQNVKVIEEGLWSEAGTAEFFVTDKLRTHSMVEEEITTADVAEKTSIQTDTLDNIVARLNVEKVNLLKMNIEGAEAEALRGAKRTLQKTSNIMIATHHGEERDFDTSHEVGEILRSANFKLRKSGYYYFGKR